MSAFIDCMSAPRPCTGAGREQQASEMLWDVWGRGRIQARPHPTALGLAPQHPAESYLPSTPCSPRRLSLLPTTRACCKGALFTWCCHGHASRSLQPTSPRPGRVSDPIPIPRDWLQHRNPALIHRQEATTSSAHCLQPFRLPAHRPWTRKRKRRSGTKGACTHTWVRAGSCGGGWRWVRPRGLKGAARTGAPAARPRDRKVRGEPERLLEESGDPQLPEPRVPPRSQSVPASPPGPACIADRLTLRLRSGRHSGAKFDEPSLFRCPHGKGWAPPFLPGLAQLMRPRAGSTVLRDMARSAPAPPAPSGPGSSPAPSSSHAGSRVLLSSPWAAAAVS